jgi:hypothetical protein
MSGPGPRRGRPDFAGDQRTEILRLLREAGPRGVSKEFLIFDMHMTQCGARVFELERMGYQIRHESRDGERYVTFVLVSEPAQPKPLPTFKPKSGDWYEKTTGKPRPATEPPDLGPLFSFVSSATE